MPAGGIQLVPHDRILTFDEITGFTRVAVANGIKKVRITGGEPLVRKDIVELVSMIAGIKGIEDLSMTTNGILLGQFAAGLKAAGLQRVNVSLDTVDREMFRTITGSDRLNDVLEGIRLAREAGLTPVKINCVINGSRDTPDAAGVAEYCAKNDLVIRYIHQMDLNKGQFSTVIGGHGGNCSICNRLRLTATGMLKPCLFNDIEFNVRELGFENAIREAVNLKPACGSFNRKGKFYNIGG
jgi:cyclic pyranopterin phosphate synthase